MENRRRGLVVTIFLVVAIVPLAGRTLGPAESTRPIALVDAGTTPVYRVSSEPPKGHLPPLTKK